MRLFVAVIFAVVSVSSAQHQQQVDPAFLRQYYSQIAQEGGAQAPQARAAPIYESQEQPQYLQQQHQQQGPLKNVSLNIYVHPFQLNVEIGGLNCVGNVRITVIQLQTVSKTRTTSTATSLRPRATTPAKTISATTSTGNYF